MSNKSVLIDLGHGAIRIRREPWGALITLFTPSSTLDGDEMNGIPTGTMPAQSCETTCNVEQCEAIIAALSAVSKQDSGNKG